MLANEKGFFSAQHLSTCGVPEGYCNDFSYIDNEITSELKSGSSLILQKNFKALSALSPEV